MYAIYTTPYFDKLHKCYYNIIVIEPSPTNILKQHVVRANIPNITPGCGESKYNCVDVFKGSKNHKYMTVEEMPLLFELFISNNISFQTDITKMIMKSGIQRNSYKLLCFIEDNH